MFASWVKKRKIFILGELLNCYRNNKCQWHTMPRCFTPETLVPSSCFILLWWCKSNCRVSLIDRLSWSLKCLVLMNYQQFEQEHQCLVQLFSTISSPGVRITLRVPGNLPSLHPWLCCVVPQALEPVLILSPSQGGQAMFIQHHCGSWKLLQCFHTSHCAGGWWNGEAPPLQWGCPWLPE